MTLNVPLTVRLFSYQPLPMYSNYTPEPDLHITAQVRDLSFRSEVPGGFKSATFALDRPLKDAVPELAPYMGVAVYDARTAATVWEGTVEDVGKGVSADGETWHVTAAGSAAHASDRTFPIVYVDSNMKSWEAMETSGGSWNLGLEVRESDDFESMLMRWPKGTGVGDGTSVVQVCGFQYRQLEHATQRVAWASGNFDCGKIDASGNRVFEVAVKTGLAGVWGVAESRTWTTTETAWSISVATDWTAGHNRVRLYAGWRGVPGTMSADDNWVRVTSLRVRGTLYSKDGTQILTAYGNDYSTITQVVEDLLGRVLFRYDGANAVIDSGAFAIRQLAYPDGITAAGVLDDLQLFTPNRYWAAWERNPATGKYRFEWTLWPTTVRYEADIADGYDASAGDLELYNRVAVHYDDKFGRPKSVTVTSNVSVLDEVQVVRSPAPITLADEINLLENAQEIGANFLAEHATPPNAGTLTVARPIFDRTRQCAVQPWEIRPGQLIRVRGILPNVDSLNRTARDSVTVFKVTAVEYQASSNTATLELDSRPRTVEQLLARLEQRRLKRWHRR